MKEHVLRANFSECGSTEMISRKQKTSERTCAVFVIFPCWVTPFLSALFHHERRCKKSPSVSLSHTEVFGCHLFYVILNSRATCFMASSGRVMTGG